MWGSVGVAGLALSILSAMVVTPAPPALSVSGVAGAVAERATASDGSDPSFLDHASVRPLGRPKTFRVSPHKYVFIRIPGVGTITGGKKTVTRPGAIRVTKYTGQVDGVTTAGIGLDVVMRKTRLLKPLKLTQRVSRRPQGTVPVFTHRRHDGLWELRPAKVDKLGRMVVRTRRFSINLPGWMDVGPLADGVGSVLAQYIGGRTSPVSCPQPAPSWMTVSNLTVSSHACGQANPAPDGGARAEVRIKNNRAAVQQVSLGGSRDFVYVNGQPDALRAAIGKLTGTNPANTVFLAPGEDGYMTVGYRQPSETTTVSNEITHTWRSVLLTTAFLAIKGLADVTGDKIKWIAAVSLAQECLPAFDISGATGADPASLRPEDYVAVLRCFVETSTKLADPGTAFGIASDLTEGKLHGYSTRQLTQELTKVGRKLVTYGVLFKVLSLGTVLFQTLQTLADSVVELVTEGGGRQVLVTMSSPGAPAPGPAASPVQPPVPPSSVQVVADNRVTNGATAMREDDQPAYLSTVKANFCKRDGCAVPSTDFWSGAVLRAECSGIGNRTTNGQDNSSIDDHNPGLFTTYRWYGIRWGDGRFGYVSEAWLAAPYRGGLGLRAC